MQIRVSVTLQSLKVQVQFINETRDEIFLKNWLHDWYGVLNDPTLDKFKNRKAKPTRALAYVCLGSGNEAVLLSGDGPDAQGTASPMQPRRPFGTLLAPGQRFEGEIELPLPLLEWHAHEPPSAERTRKVNVSRVRYRIEWLRRSNASDQLHLREWGDVWRIDGRPVEVSEATAALPSPVLLLARTDRFPRFG